MNLKRITDSEKVLRSGWSESYDIFDNNLYIGQVVINEHPDMYLLFKLYIFEKDRRKGYATKFLQSLPTDKKIRLAVSKTNKNAIELYQKNGFFQIGEGLHWYWYERP